MVLALQFLLELPDPPLVQGTELLKILLLGHRKHRLCVGIGGGLLRIQTSIAAVVDELSVVEAGGFQYDR